MGKSKFDVTYAGQGLTAGVSGSAHGLVPLTSPCEIYVPTRRAALLEPYSCAPRLVTVSLLPLTAPR